MPPMASQPSRQPRRPTTRATDWPARISSSAGTSSRPSGTMPRWTEGSGPTAMPTCWLSSQVADATRSADEARRGPAGGSPGGHDDDRGEHQPHRGRPGGSRHRRHEGRPAPVRDERGLPWLRGNAVLREVGHATTLAAGKGGGPLRRARQQEERLVSAQPPYRPPTSPPPGYPPSRRPFPAAAVGGRRGRPADRRRGGLLARRPRQQRLDRGADGLPRRRPARLAPAGPLPRPPLRRLPPLQRRGRRPPRPPLPRRLRRRQLRPALPPRRPSPRPRRRVPR